MLLLSLTFEFQNQSNLFNCRLHVIFFLQTIFYTFLFQLYFTLLNFTIPKNFFSSAPFSNASSSFFFLFSFSFYLLLLRFPYLLSFHLLPLGPPSFFLSLFAFLIFLFSLSSFGQLSHPFSFSFFLFSFFFFFSLFFSFSRPTFAPVISNGDRGVSYVEYRHCNDGVWREDSAA